MWWPESLSPPDSQCSPYKQCSRWRLWSQHQMDAPDIRHACCQSWLQPLWPLLLQQFPFQQGFWRMWFWDWLPESQLLAIVVAPGCRNNLLKSLRFTGDIWWISGYNHSFALSRSVSGHLVAACWTPFGPTCNWLYFDVVTLSAMYSWTSIEGRIVWILCSRNWLDSLANCPFTLGFADFVIFLSQMALYF